MDVIFDSALMAECGTAADDVLCRWSLPVDNVAGARRRSLLARALLREMLVRATGIPPADWMFGSEPSGRPIAQSASCDRIPSVSLSHSGGWVACAVSYAAAFGSYWALVAGIVTSRILRVAAAAFGPEEQWRVAGEGASGFYRIWTLKEAMAKASGVGIAQVVDRTDRVAKGPKEGLWRANIGATPWWLAHRTPVSGLSLAVAIPDMV